jgi:hypothetical protein
MNEIIGDGVEWFALVWDGGGIGWSSHFELMVMMWSQEPPICGLSSRTQVIGATGSVGKSGRAEIPTFGNSG